MTSSTSSRPVAIVTGGASGIGAAITQRLAASGAHVVVADVNASAAAAQADALTEAGTPATAVELDVTSRQSWADAVALTAQVGRVTILVNNAGFTRDRTLLKMTDDEWNAVIGVHLTGAFLGCQAVIPLMKAGGGGAIVNVSSDARHGAFGQTNYSAAKAGIIGLTRTAALEHAKDGIRINAVAPGPVNTGLIEAVPSAVREQWLSTIPLARFAEPAEVAAVVAFLTSQESSYITGHVIPVDGGATAP
jgi:3-oxoacyl-[acyl-carrier protein] reductase